MKEQPHRATTRRHNVLRLIALIILVPICSAFGEVTLTDHYFFAESVSDIHKTYNSEELFRASTKRTESRKVHTGQVFGFRITFPVVYKKLRLHVELKVPSQPEHFPVHNGKLTIKGNTVIVDDLIDGNDGTVSYYWSVNDNDSRGNYSLGFSLDDNKVTTYEFTVE